MLFFKCASDLIVYVAVKCHMCGCMPATILSLASFVLVSLLEAAAAHCELLVGDAVNLSCLELIEVRRLYLPPACVCKRLGYVFFLDYCSSLYIFLPFRTSR